MKRRDFLITTGVLLQPGLLGARVRMHLESAGAVKQVRALRSGKAIQHQVPGNTVEFVVPEVRDYEVAAIASEGRS